MHPNLQSFTNAREHATRCICFREIGKVVASRCCSRANWRIDINLHKNETVTTVYVHISDFLTRMRQDAERVHLSSPSEEAPEDEGNDGVVSREGCQKIERIHGSITGGSIEGRGDVIGDKSGRRRSHNCEHDRRDGSFRCCVAADEEKEKIEIVFSSSTYESSV